ncbi:MAG: CPBP family glutamic-type intramembrane protease [Acidimicrobiales bacterium]
MPAPPNRWGLSEALFGFAAGILVSAAATFAVEAATGYRTSSGAPLPLAVTAADVGGLWAGLVAAVVLASRRGGTGRLSKDYGLALRWWDLPVGAAVGVVAQYWLVPALYLPVEAADHRLGRHIARQLGGPTLRETGAVHGPGRVVLLYLLLAVGAPVVEELFFRGLLLRGLLGRLPAAPAVLASAVLFAVAHFELLQFAGLAAFGVVLGALSWRSGRLGAGIAAHAAFNAAALAASVQIR